MGDKKYYVIVNEVHYGPFNLEEIKHHEHLLPNTQILEAGTHTFFKASEMNELKYVFAGASDVVKDSAVVENDNQASTSSKDVRAIGFSIFKILAILTVILLLLYMNQSSEKPVNHTSEQEIEQTTEAVSRLKQMKTEAELKDAKLAQIKLLEKSCWEAENALQAAQLERKNIDAFKFFRTAKKKATQLAAIDAEIAAIQQEILLIKAEINQLQTLH